MYVYMKKTIVNVTLLLLVRTLKNDRFQLWSAIHDEVLHTVSRGFCCFLVEIIFGRKGVCVSQYSNNFKAVLKQNIDHLSEFNNKCSSRLYETDIESLVKAQNYFSHRLVMARSSDISSKKGDVWSLGPQGKTRLKLLCKLAATGRLSDRQSWDIFRVHIPTWFCLQLVSRNSLQLSHGFRRSSYKVLGWPACRFFRSVIAWCLGTMKTSLCSPLDGLFLQAISGTWLSTLDGFNAAPHCCRWSILLKMHSIVIIKQVLHPLSTL